MNPEQEDSSDITDADLREAGLDEFCFEHLPTELSEVSRDFATLAYVCTRNRPSSPKVVEQRKNTLHYLLLAKDAAVRMEVMEQRLKK